MNSEEQNPMPEDSIEIIDADETSSVDDFIRELEAKERDLCITADLSIEIADSEFDMDSDTSFVKKDLAPPPVAAIASPTAAPVVNKARNFMLENENAALKVRVMELKVERNQIQEMSDRRVKDFESFKYRMDRERRGSVIDHTVELASQMLPVLDNLDRALISVEAFEGPKSPEFQQFLDGIVLVNQQVNEVFAGMGVQPITTVGETFDPNFHEAVAADVRADMPPNTITQELLRGYRIGNKVIRHSMVRVTAASPAKENFTLSDDPQDESASAIEGE